MAENNHMSLFLRSVIVIIVGLGSSYAVAQDNSAQEFQVKKEMSEERVADFYTRLILLERETLRREQGAEVHRKERQRLAAEMKKAAREFKRPQPVDTEEAAKAYEKELAARRRAAEVERKEYVRRRDEMRRWERSVGSIPENIEYGIETPSLSN